MCCGNPRSSARTGWPARNLFHCRGYTPTNISQKQTFELTAAHFEGLEEPRLHAVGLQFISSNVDAWTANPYRHAVRVNAELGLPRRPWSEANPLRDSGRIEWATGGSFRFDGIRMVDVENGELMAHARFNNISPIGNWSVQVLPNALLPHLDNQDVGQVQNWVGDLRLILSLSVKAPAGT
ncbi:hypothetical protein AAFN86_29325 [Roseomonas sp. CAU 1739]|uniref:hypothetical protein n=1 Tax=Roseomonas sp. CAU 1739 TaxID=3140364 RepID=UPI00325B03A6